MMTSFAPLRLAALRCGCFLLGVWAIACASGASAETLYATGAQPLASAPSEDAVPLAALSVASELILLETGDRFHRVALEGWAREGAERVLFALPGKRILVAQIARESVGQMEHRDSLEDPDTEILWNRMRIEGWVDATNVQQELQPIWDNAWALFSKRCTACHQRRVPSHYTANQWRSLIKVMGPRTGLPKADQTLILTFLQHHASDTIELQGGGTDGADAPATGR